MTPERDTIDAVRRTLQTRASRPSSTDRVARTDVALVNGWLRSLTSVEERNPLAEGDGSDEVRVAARS